MRHGSLFSGIGGFDLAATWMGWKNMFNCEKDTFCQRVLQYYWPEAKSFKDIITFNATEFRGTVDIISGGFPCQPFSIAGQRLGSADDRYLWPHARRIIEEAKPRWIVFENVAGLFTILEPESLSQMEIKEIELFCENDELATSRTIVRIQRRVIATIISDISTAGYSLPTLKDGTPIVSCIPACAVNAPHRRDRIWFIAHSNHFARPSKTKRRQMHEPKGHPIRNFSSSNGHGRITTDAFSCGQLGQKESEEELEHGAGREAFGNSHGNGRFRSTSYSDIEGLERATSEEQQRHTERFAWSNQICDWKNWPTQPPVCCRNDGIPGELDNISLSKWRQESVKAFGNAIVPQVALEIFRAIEMTEPGVQDTSL